MRFLKVILANTRHLTAVLLTLHSLHQPAAAGKYYDNYVPFSNQQIGKVFPQKKKIVDQLQIPSTSTNAGITSTVTNNCDLILSGADALNKPWHVKDSVTAGGGSIWQADLDGNGQQDLIVVLWTTACGIAPPCKLLLVMFDRNKKPTAFQITGFFAQKSDGIQDLRKLPGMKSAVLLERALANDLKATKNYWKHSAWQASPDHSWRALSSLDNTKLPCYVLFTNKPNHKRSIPDHIASVNDDQLVQLQPAAQ